MLLPICHHTKCTKRGDRGGGEEIFCFQKKIVNISFLISGCNLATVGSPRLLASLSTCSAKIAGCAVDPLQLRSAAFDIKSDSLGFFDPFSNTERERGKSCLHSKVVKFDHVKVSVVFICK